jgi:hypothetical protein
MGADIAAGGRLPADRSVALLLLANLVTLLLAVWQRWELAELLWIYWGQSVIIGWFNLQRIRSLERFSTAGLRMNGRAVAPTRKTRREVALFFALHYGGFHAGYLVFLASDAHRPGPQALTGILLCIAAFYLNHRFSWRYHRAREAGRVPNIGNIMFFPYLRIIPMHLTILLGGALSGDSLPVLVLFMLLKTAADVAMHVIEHVMARGDVQRAAGRRP